jgi:hypothetical protein
MINLSNEGCWLMKSENVIPQNQIMSALPPVVTQAKWAELIGLPVGSVEAAVARRIWPSIKFGRHNLINVEAIRIALAKKSDEFTL